MSFNRLQISAHGKAESSCSMSSWLVWTAGPCSFVYTRCEDTLTLFPVSFVGIVLLINLCPCYHIFRSMGDLRFHSEVKQAVGSYCRDLYSQKHLKWKHCCTVGGLLEECDQLERAAIRLWRPGICWKLWSSGPALPRIHSVIVFFNWLLKVYQTQVELFKGWFLPLCTEIHWSLLRKKHIDYHRKSPSVS